MAHQEKECSYVTICLQETCSFLDQQGLIQVTNLLKLSHRGVTSARQSVFDGSYIIN